jgi:hypothetical protein
MLHTTKLKSEFKKRGDLVFDECPLSPEAV